MRSLYKVLLAAGLVALLAEPALAQRGRGGFGMFGGGAMLLGNEGVQKELKMSPEQIDKAKDAVQKLLAKQKEMFGQFQGLSREEMREKMTAVGREMSEAGNKAAAEILKPEQLTRYKQIELQQQGFLAFGTPETQTALKLTAEQKEKIKTLTADANRELGELRPQGGGGDFQEMIKKMTALRKETLDKIASILTADQKAAWKTLTGEPFEVRFERGRRPNN
jgi:Spy/CpxP family protein refolding chaperone